MNGLNDSGRGPGRFNAAEFDFRDLPLTALFHEIFLKGQGTGLGMHNGPNALITHGKQGCFNAPLPSNLGGHLAECPPLAKLLGTKQVGCEVSIA